jgi:hypothetical protein
MQRRRHDRGAHLRAGEDQERQGHLTHLGDALQGDGEAGPAGELLRNLFGITDQDGPREARQKIAGELALLGMPSPTTVSWCSTSSASAIPRPPLELEPAVRQRRLFTFLRRLIQLRTGAEPIVLLIDDLHSTRALISSWRRSFRR